MEFTNKLILISFAYAYILHQLRSQYSEKYKSDEHSNLLTGLCSISLVALIGLFISIDSFYEKIGEYKNNFDLPTLIMDFFGAMTSSLFPLVFAVIFAFATYHENRDTLKYDLINLSVFVFICLVYFGVLSNFIHQGKMKDLIVYPFFSLISYAFGHVIYKLDKFLSYKIKIVFILVCLTYLSLLGIFSSS